MTAEKVRVRPKLVRPILVVALGCLFLLIWFVFFSSSPAQSKLFVLGPYVQTYPLVGARWDFPLTLFGFGPGAGTARLVEFSIHGHDVLPLVGDAQRTLPVSSLDNEISAESFGKWRDYRRRAAEMGVSDAVRPFSAAEESEFMELERLIRGIGGRRRDIVPTTLLVNVADLPFAVAPDGHYMVKIAFERDQVRSSWEGQVLIIVLGQ